MRTLLAAALVGTAAAGAVAAPASAAVTTESLRRTVDMAGSQIAGCAGNDLRVTRGTAVFTWRSRETDRRSGVRSTETWQGVEAVDAAGHRYQVRQRGVSRVEDRHDGATWISVHTGRYRVRALDGGDQGGIFHYRARYIVRNNQVARNQFFSRGSC